VSDGGETATLTRRLLLLGLAATVAAPAAGCGRKGPPQPPSEVEPDDQRRDQ